ncbi:hypothetical protein [Heliophilum fasciatum]|uniref:Uncharacterized protein n=1 Tax=Heliophilum fasciatum TaxID=35700 RepID=A0A4R2RY65_9FIRM|nr:hypothetical protein [Heliophilum fasciatum]MCW2276951.1 hypothetical protein [Heliophilum fasciatum]TCP68523.1 hypothetical protein EDD73_103157 [Heliophilum fasciatum]
MKDNGMSDFRDFIDSYPKYSKYTNNVIAEKIFELLSDLENVNKMILTSQADKPALSACIQQIEELFGEQNTFDLTDDFTKQALGTMVKVVLQPFGYDAIKQKDMPKGLSKYVRSASVYSKNSLPKLKLVTKLSVEKVLD